MVCYLCGSEENAPVFQNEKMLVLKCQQCGLVFQDQSEEGFDERIEEYYSNRPIVDLSFSTEAMDQYRDIADFIVSNYRGGDLLDVGSGTGSLLLTLSQRGMRCTGIEPNKTQAEYSAQQGFTVLNTALKADLFPRNSFDVITLMQVLEHLPKPIDALRIASQYLRPQGTIIISVPSYNNPRFLVYRLTGNKRIVKGDFILPHLYYYTPGSLQNIVQKAGLNVHRLDCGRYSVKFGESAPYRLADKVAGQLKIGGIVLYAR